jgi:hypothetical protein
MTSSVSAEVVRGRFSMKWVKKILLIMVVTFAVFYLVTQPTAAAGAVRGVFDAIATAFASIITFFTTLAG